MKFVGKAIEIIQTLRDKAQSKSEAPDQTGKKSADLKEKIKPDVVADPVGLQEEQTIEPGAYDVDHLLRQALLPGSDPGKDAVRLTDALLYLFQSLLSELPATLPQINITNCRVIREPNFPARVLERQPSTPSYYRWRAANADLCLSVRATEAIVELFIMQADEIALLSYSEFGSRRKARFEQVRTASGYVWMLNKIGANADKVKELMRSCLSELRQQTPPEDEISQAKAGERAGIDPVQQLMLEKENLIFKVLNQQETIKNELARSLHDTVLADLLMLKRHMRGDQELSKEEIIETIDEISQQLRDICNECAPRNLHDWGLKVSVQDLLNRFGQRTAIDTMLQCEVDIPNLPAVVELHIFRLIQESLNNIEKHARASQVKIFIESLKEHSLRFRVVDNGMGFTSGVLPRSTDSGGMGLTGMGERAQLVRCFYATEFVIDSKPGQGTTISLELTVPS